MREDSIQLEEKRLEDVQDIDDYNMIHERHRVFPQLFENRDHKRIIDIQEPNARTVEALNRLVVPAGVFVKIKA